MESLTKNKQSRETIRKMAEKYFPDDPLKEYEELTEGYFNVAYEVIFESGRRVILKVAPPEGLSLIHIWTGLYEVLKARLNIRDEELESWSRVREKMYLPKGKENGLLEQFEGYFDLKDVTIEAYDENDWPIRPEILRTVPKTQTQIIKQADVVMLLHLLGEEFDEETKRKNYTYYEKRTLHGSSLSPSIYSVMGLHVGDETKAYRYLRRAAFIDLTDLQKNTREGIHAANAGGCLLYTSRSPRRWTV